MRDGFSFVRQRSHRMNERLLPCHAITAGRQPPARLAGVEHAQRIDAGFGETVAESKDHPLRFPQPRRWRRVRTLQCPIASGALFDYAGRGPPT
jgi:hypothetical protein